MSQLDDFNNTAPSYSIDDLVDPPASAAPITSLGSNRNTAAFASMLTPDDSKKLDVYHQSNDELNQSGVSPTASAAVADAQGASLAGYQASAADLLLKPDASDEWKAQAITRLNDPENPLFSPRAMVTTQAAEKSVPSETNEAADLRGLYAAGVQDVLNYQREKQKVYNEMQLKQDANKAAPWVSAAEDFVPLAYGYKQARISQDFFGGDSSAVKTMLGTVLSGSSTAARNAAFNRIPLEDRARMLHSVADMISANGQTILLPEGSDQGNMRALQDTIESGSYTTTDETIDNILGVLDVVGIGGVIRKGLGIGKAIEAGADAAEGGARAATQGSPRRPTPGTDWRTGETRSPGTFNQEGMPSDAMREWEMMTPAERGWQRNFITSDVQPTTPAQTIKDANPKMLRDIHEATETDAAGDIANTMYGASREDAIAHDIAPQVSTPAGDISGKVYHPEQNSDFAFMPDAEIMDFVDNSGASWFTPSEKYRLRSQAVNDFTNATGFTYRKEMSTVSDAPDGVTFSSVLGPSDTGWGNIDDAVNHVAFAYKNYGVTPEDMKVLVRQGDSYVPMDVADAVKNSSHGGVVPPNLKETGNPEAGSSPNKVVNGMVKGDDLSNPDYRGETPYYSDKGYHYYTARNEDGTALDVSVFNDEGKSVGQFSFNKEVDGQHQNPSVEIWKDSDKRKGIATNAYNIAETVGGKGFVYRGSDVGQQGVRSEQGQAFHSSYDKKPFTPVERTKYAGQPGVGGDFLVQINHTQKYSAGDVLDEGWEAFTVKRNLMDSWFKNSGRSAQGSVASNLLDPQSMLDFNFTKGATISGSREASLEVMMSKKVKDYTDSVQGLPHNEAQQLFAKIREANIKGESYNYTNMKAEGFSDKAITSLEKWKSAQDTLYSISNRDMVKSYKARGYGVMEHKDSGTRLFVREQSRSAVKDGTMVYDPIKGTASRMTADEITDLYSRNGNIAKTVNPMEVNGVHVEHVINQNSANGTYVRALKDHDTVLNYRKGYYAVRYEDPHFIERRVVDENGKPLVDAGGREVWKAVATADTVPNAKRGIARLQATKGGEYRYRNNLKGEAFDAATAQSMQAGGMSSQRLRGERLEEGVGKNTIDSDTHIEAPINSLIHATSSISHRVSHRDWIETAKARFISQYGDVLPKREGRVQFPSSRDDIGHAGMDSKMARDARTTYEYIRQIENGFTNGIDDGYKALFNIFADGFGELGMGTIEKATRAVGKATAPAAGIKKLAFNLLLALNPLRQFLVQSHQALMLAASFPRYAVSRMVPDMAMMLTKHLAEGTKVKIPDSYWRQWGRSPEEAEAMFQALKQSGIGASIRQHDLVREGLNSVADSSAYTRFRYGTTPVKMALGGARTVMGAARKIGFDFGEYLSSASSFLAHYDDALSKGVKMDKAGVEDTFAKSRNYVYNMDRAGAMPYNHNNVSMFTQFLQVPHKAFTQLLFNRGIPRAQRGRMFAFMTAMYGPTAVIGVVPGSGDAIENFFGDLFPEDPTLRNALRTGLETYILNKAFTQFYGEEVDLDYSSLAPLDAYGITKFIQTAFDEGITKVVTNSPGGSLLFGTNPRVATVLSTMGSLMGMGDAKEKDPVKWSNMWKDIAMLSSGYSNAAKAQMMLEYGKKYGALGGTTDSNVNTFEAVAQAFGIPTADSERTRKILDSTWKTQEAFDSDVKGTYAKYARMITADGVNADQAEYIGKMWQIEMAAYGNNDRAAKIWMQEFNKQLADGNTRVADKVLQMGGWAKPEDTKRLVDTIPGITEIQRQNLRTVLDYNFSMRTDLNKDKK